MPDFLLLLTLAAVVAALPQQQSQQKPAFSVPAGFTRTLFTERFTSFSQWNGVSGTSYPGGPSNWGTGEIQSYTRSSVNIAITPQGTLQIVPIVASATNPRGQRVQQWTSARIETTPQHDFACPAGGRILVQAAIKLGGAAAATQQGIWPAFWSLGSRFRGNYSSWPSVGEIDILESVNGMAAAWHTIHCGPSASGGPCKEPNGLGVRTAEGTFTRGVWHVVGVEIDRRSGTRGWRGESMAWFIDGRETWRIRSEQVGDERAWASLAADKRFLLLNVAVGGGLPDAIAGAKTPNARTNGGQGAGLEVGWIGIFVS